MAVGYYRGLQERLQVAVGYYRRLQEAAGGCRRAFCGLSETHALGVVRDIVTPRVCEVEGRLCKWTHTKSNSQNMAPASLYRRSRTTKP